MKKSYRYVTAVFIIFIILGTGFILIQKQPKKLFIKKSVSDLMRNKKEESVDFKASFAIFTNGTFRVFTASMYHNLSEDVFIEAENPNIVHVKKSGITWDDFFKTLPFKLTRECLTTGTGQTFCDGQNDTLKFYLNGEKTDNLLDSEIHKGDQVLISYGNEKTDEIDIQLKKLGQIK